MHEKVTKIALQQLGNAGGRKFWSWWGYSSRVPWCQIFVSWVMEQAGVPKEIYGKYENCEYAISELTKKGVFHKNGYRPKAGDVIYYDWDGWGSDHVGIVFDFDGTLVYVIEGNKGDKVDKRILPYNHKQIVGYASPKYPDSRKKNKDGTYTVKKGDSLSEIGERFDCSVAELQKWNDLKSTKIVVGQKLKLFYRKEKCIKRSNFRVAAGTEAAKIAVKPKIEKGEVIEVLGSKKITVKGEKRKWYRARIGEIVGWCPAKKFEKMK